MTTLSKLFTLFGIAFIWVVISGQAQAGSIEGVAYSIISDTDLLVAKRSIDVRLDKKISVEALSTIARELKNMERKKYERTFVTYYLPNMKVDAGAWATSHFNPELEVKVLGLTAEEEDKMTREAKSTSRDVVGIWMDDRPYVGVVITIYREKSKLYLESKYKDGSSSTKKMTETKTANGSMLVEKGGNPNGDYLVLDKEGKLEAGDNDGIFLKYKKLK